ncbi:vitamin-D-receptor interacting mediator subunit 4-domain-containing protein [Irpex lacteus]|nr:vitamin-D-receptor interacting mediator subunit 4-domain-containing protein [Irpex lacteus]
MPAPPSLPVASLTSEPITDILTAPLQELQALSHTLFHSLSPTQARPPPVPPLQAFLEVDARLAEAVKLARIHQIRQRQIERLKDEVVKLEEGWRESVKELMDGKTLLESVLAEADERVKAIEKAKAADHWFASAAIPYPELLAYAQSLSAFTSAPPNMPDITLSGQPPPPLFFPPFPNEEKMRRGRMNAEAPLALLGETHSVGKAPSISPRSVEMPSHMPGANPYRPDLRMDQQQVFDLDLDLNPDL